MIEQFFMFWKVILQYKNIQYKKWHVGTFKLWISPKQYKKIQIIPTAEHISSPSDRTTS